MKNIILITGSIFTLLLAVLWYFNFISEPLVAIGTGILTTISYILVPDEKRVNKNTINQKHSGQGDNVIGEKVVNNNLIKIKNSENTTVQLANSLVNNNYTIVAQEKESEKGNAKISKFTAIEIRKAVDESPVFQREEIAKNYRGIRIKWKVTLNSIIPKSENTIKLMTNFEGKYPWVYFQLDLKEHPNLKVAKQGCEFIVTGLILNYKNNVFDIDLENLEEV